MSNEYFENRFTCKIALRAMLQHMWPFSRNSKSTITDSAFTQVKLTPLKIFVMWMKLRNFKETE
ncbi:MAG: hypothetical protein EPO62_01765 [Candidatus Nitrosotenuis sp.]|nr:MAG: hypothetical protein EPO62_01765 [Candidatus Nitrosotenuis sp.]